MINDFDISEIEQDMIRILRDEMQICRTVYNNRQKSAPHKEEYVVCHVSGGVRDYACYGTCYLLIELYAKNMNNAKNYQKLSVMYQKLIESLPAYSGRYEFELTPRILGDSEDDFGFTCRIVQINTLIKVKQ